MRIAVAGGTGLVGTHVVEMARAAGHEVVVISRSEGVNTRTGEGLAQALKGVDVVIDSTNLATTDAAEAIDFFTSSAANLQRESAAQGVRKLVVLSIVGIDRSPGGYYEAKVAQEKAALAGSVPVIILRATQFHEYAAQMLSWSHGQDVAPIPDLHVQPVAARTASSVLLELATSDSQPGSTVELAGPEHAQLADLARRMVEHFGLATRVEAAEAGMPDGSLVPQGEARIEGPTFEEWLASPDAAAIAEQI